MVYPVEVVGFKSEFTTINSGKIVCRRVNSYFRLVITFLLMPRRV